MSTRRIARTELERLRYLVIVVVMIGTGTVSSVSPGSKFSTPVVRRNRSAQVAVPLGGVVDGHRQRTRWKELHRECERPIGFCHAIGRGDRQCWRTVVVVDDPHLRRQRCGNIDWRGELQGEGLIILVQSVCRRHHRHVLGGLTDVEDEGAARRCVVTGRYCGTVHRSRSRAGPPAPKLQTASR